MDKETVTYLIAVIGCLVGIYGWYKGQKKDTIADQEILREIRENVIKISIKQEQQCSAVGEIQTDIKATRNEVDSMKLRMMKLEMRVDNLENSENEQG